MKVLMEFGTRTDEQHEKLNKELKYIKKNQSELKNTITMRKYAKQNQQLIRWHRSMNEQSGGYSPRNYTYLIGKGINKNKDSLSCLCDKNKCTICTMRVLKWREE